MASIWNDIELEWEGETYTVRPTIEFLNYLEQGNGSSLSNMLIRLGKSDLPTGKACELISRTLNYAGANVTPNDVFEKTGGVGIEMISAAQVILMGCMPAPKEKTTKKKTDHNTAQKN